MFDNYNYSSESDYLSNLFGLLMCNLCLILHSQNYFLVNYLAVGRLVIQLILFFFSFLIL